MISWKYQLNLTQNLFLPSLLFALNLEKIREKKKKSEITILPITNLLDTKFFHVREVNK